MKHAWHFTGPTLRDGSPIPAIGKKLVFKGTPIMCKQGLHFSLHPFDALQYAPGPFLHKVSYGGIVELGEDKGVCTERTILASIDATVLLRKFACDVALGVLPKDAPDIVRRYLTTQDESLRSSARSSARNAARDAAWCAAWDATRDAAWCAAWDATRNAAWCAARDAAREKHRSLFLARVKQAFNIGANAK